VLAALLVHANEQVGAERRSAHAAAVLGEALGLWRGAAFADVRYEPFARVEIARLGCMRVSETTKASSTGALSSARHGDVDVASRTAGVTLTRARAGGLVAST
jgi:hypothetical protein